MGLLAAENSPGEVGSSNRRGYFLRKPVALALVLAAVATCVVVGLIVYYAGVANYKCATSEDAMSETSTSKPKKVLDVKLPRHLVPSKYRVELIPFLIPDNYTIRGFVEMTLKCEEGGSSNVTVHAKDMDIDEASIQVEEMGGGKTFEVTGTDTDKEREFYIVNLNSDLREGKTYKMRMNFVAKLQQALNGFYRSDYTNQDGKKVTIATTQFQATDARKAFPCFDEPALKAKVEASLGRKRSYSSISNMPIKAGQKGVAMPDDPEYVWDHFEESVPMSTYLIAFVVSDYGYVTSAPTGNGVEFKIWARKNALDQVELANNIGAKILKFFEDYYEVPYPLPKQDMIAIPDFSAGAMENWGLITYRETALLFKPGVSRAVNKERVATVVSHELAHQWFGNLVTPSWWTDLWLNEGFASYVEYLGVEAALPEVKLLEQFITDELQSVMEIDALATSHPISIPVNHPDEIAEIFDRISYAKGASIIRMMNHFLTEETFRKGLKSYLEEFKFKAAEQDDLWRHLSQQAHKDKSLPDTVSVKDIMDTWTLQMGFPVVNVERDYDGRTATFSQERYLDGEAPESDTHDYKWWIPINYAKPGGDFNTTKPQVWLKNDGKPKKLEKISVGNKEALIVNVQETGYYRVNYDKKNWQLLANVLENNHLSIHVSNRAQILDDAFNLAKSGRLDYETALSLTSFLKHEQSYIVWYSALKGFGYLNKMMKRTAAYGEFKKYMKKQLMPLYTRLGTEEKPNEDHLDVLLRASIINWACSMGVEECKENAKMNFNRWMNTPEPDNSENNPIGVNLKSSIYCNAIREGSEDEWQFGWDRYQSANVASEKSLMLQSLGCASDVWLLNRYLNWSLTEGSGIRPQDGRTVIGAVAGNINGRDLAFDFIRNKWDHVLKYYAGSAFTIPGIVKSVLKNRNTEFELKEIQDFQKANADRLSSGQRIVKQSIESTSNNINWMDKNFENIFDWLKTQNN